MGKTCPGSPLERCSKDYFLGQDLGCPLKSVEIRWDSITAEDKIRQILSVPPRKNLWRFFGAYWQTSNVWMAIDLVSNLTVLKEAPEETLRFIYAYPDRFPCYSHAGPDLIHPRYEDVIICLIMAIIAGVVGGIGTVEYQRWRDRKNQKLEELEHGLSLLCQATNSTLHLYAHFSICVNLRINHSLIV